MTEQVLSRYGIGGSQAAAIIGQHPYTSPIDAFCEIKGIGDPFTGNEATYWGTAKEAAIRARYRNDVDGTVTMVGRSMFRGSAGDPSIVSEGSESHWQRATPDGLVDNSKYDDSGHLVTEATEEWGLEVKTANSRVAHRWGPSGSDVYPIEYRIQCLWYMHVTGLDRWDIAVLIDSADYREYRIERTPEVQAEIDSMVEDVTRFWHDHIVANVAPPPDASGGYAKYLATVHPRATVGEFVEADGDMDATIELLQLAKSKLRTIGALKDGYENYLKAAIGDAPGITSDLGKITWNEQQGRVNWKSVAAEIHSHYTARGQECNRDSETLDSFAEDNRCNPTRVMRTPRSWGKK